MRFLQGPVKWGIIGCGDVCEVKSGPAFSKVPDSSLVAVMRRDLEKAKDFALRHQVPRFYSEASQLIQDPEVNAIYIATPPASHEDYAIQAMRAGKPVYIEKPVTVSAEACRHLITVSNELQIPVSVAHYRRKLSLFERIKSYIEADELGDIRMIILQLFQAPKSDSTAGWRVTPSLSGGGLLFDLAPHQLDILYLLFGAPSHTTGLSINQRQTNGTPDVTAMTAVFGRQIIFQGLWSFNSPPHACIDSCKIIGSAGTMDFPFFSSAADTKLRIVRDGKATTEDFSFPAHIQQPLIEQVVQYFKGTAKNPCGLEEALVTLDMIEAV